MNPRGGESVDHPEISGRCGAIARCGSGRIGADNRFTYRFHFLAGRTAGWFSEPSSRHVDSVFVFVGTGLPSVPSCLIVQSGQNAPSGISR